MKLLAAFEKSEEKARMEAAKAEGEAQKKAIASLLSWGVMTAKEHSSDQVPSPTAHLILAYSAPYPHYISPNQHCMRRPRAP